MNLSNESWRKMKKTLFNFRWIFFVCIFILLILMGIFLIDDDVWISIAFIAIGALLSLGYAIFMPNSYTFSDEGITVRYCFGLKSFLCWKEIKCLEDHYAKLFPWWREYEIGYFDTKIKFHQIAWLPKNRKITEQIKKYYHKSIEKYG